jgi:hypothetical protein
VYASEFEIFGCGFYLLHSLGILRWKYHLQRCLKYSAEGGFKVNFCSKELFINKYHAINRHAKVISISNIFIISYPINLSISHDIPTLYTHFPNMMVDVLHASN